LEQPAVSQHTISSTSLINEFAAFNWAADGTRKPYRHRIKPFNFMLAAHKGINPAAASADPRTGLLFAPYTPDPRQWADMDWIDRATGARVLIVAGRFFPDRVRVKSYADLLRAYQHRPELKFAGPDGQQCRPETIGLLARLHVVESSTRLIGKEGN